MKGKTHYAIYFTWYDGEEDSFIEYGAENRNMQINYLLTKEDARGMKYFHNIMYCRIYANGEYGKLIRVS